MNNSNFVPGKRPWLRLATCALSAASFLSSSGCSHRTLSNLAEFAGPEAAIVKVVQEAPSAMELLNYYNSYPVLSCQQPNEADAIRCLQIKALDAGSALIRIRDKKVGRCSFEEYHQVRKFNGQTCTTVTAEAYILNPAAIQVVPALSATDYAFYDRLGEVECRAASGDEALGCVKQKAAAQGATLVRILRRTASPCDPGTPTPPPARKRSAPPAPQCTEITAEILRLKK